MQVKLLRSSTVIIELDGVKILCDPWLTDGEYYGSWSHYPEFKINENLSEINDVDAIYISHIHPDHVSSNTLKYISKEIPVFIHSYSSKFLKKKIELSGFTVKEIEHNCRTNIKKNVFINIFAADDCNPEICGKFFDCTNFNGIKGSNQIDSLSVIENGNKFILNANDCPFELAKIILPKIKKTYEKIDIFLVGYTGAGPYPQCFENLDLQTKIKRSEEKKLSFLQNAYEMINTIQPRYFLPFAGTYSLSGHLSKLNNLRGVASLDEAYDYLENKFNKDITRPIKLNYESTFDLDTGETSTEYNRLNSNHYDNYVKSVLGKRDLDYEKLDRPNINELKDLLYLSYNRLLEKNNGINYSTKTNVLIEYDKNKICKMSLEKNKIEFCNLNEVENLDFLLMSLDNRLLNLILKGPRYAHWNNAEIGSHIKFIRKPDIYERGLFNALCFMHS